MTRARRKEALLERCRRGSRWVLNVREGTMVLLDAGRSSDVYEATVLEVKGLALIGFGAVGTAAKGLGMAGAAASFLGLKSASGVAFATMTGPAFAVAAMAVACGGIAVLVCDMTLYGFGAQPARCNR